MKIFNFGDKISFYNHLIRRGSTDATNARYWKSDIFRYEWIKVNGRHRQKPLITTGIIIGSRTLRDGHIVYESHDDGQESCFITDKIFKAYLVATDMKRNPVYVLPKDIIV